MAHLYGRLGTMPNSTCLLCKCSYCVYVVECVCVCDCLIRVYTYKGECLAFTSLCGYKVYTCVCNKDGYKQRGVNMIVVRYMNSRTLNSIVHGRF